MSTRALLVAWLAGLLVSCAPARDPAVISLRYASPYPPGHPFSRADQRWIEHLERASWGRLRIDPYWSGMLTSADQSVVELRHGVADVAAIQPIYERGGAQALRVQTAFYAGARSFEEQVAVYTCLARHFPSFHQELRGLSVLAVQGGNLPGIVTRHSPVRSLRDLRGLRLRAPAELMDLLRSLGADPVNMPMGDVYAALARGVIDGVVAPLDALRSLHLGEVAHHYADLEVPRGAYPARAIRTARLLQLPAALQALLRDSAELWQQALSDELSRAQHSGARYAREHGIAHSHIASAEQAAFERAYNAAASARARELSALGLNGVAMFHASQDWIARLRSHARPPKPDMLCPGDLALTPPQSRR